MPRRRRNFCTVAIAASAWFWTAVAAAQTARLPAVDPNVKVYQHGVLPPIDKFLQQTPQVTYPESGAAGFRSDPGQPTPAYPGVLTAYPDSTADLPQRPLEIPPLEPEKKSNLPPGARPGIFQKLIYTGTWLAPGGEDGFGLSEMEGKVVLAFPFPLEGSHLLITPGFGVHYLDGPRRDDLPPQLFETYTQFRLMWPVREGLGFDLAFTPGVYSDFQQGTDDAVRYAGHAAAMYQWSPTVKIVAGAACTVREDGSVLPIGGIIWTPNDDWSFEIVAPRPKIARRLYWAGTLPPGVEQWIYVAGEWGGGSWAIRRADGSGDVVTLSDLRVILGWERTNIEGLDALFEVGYVFARQIDYDRGSPGLEPPDTIMLRGSLTY